MQERHERWKQRMAEKGVQRKTPSVDKSVREMLSELQEAVKKGREPLEVLSTWASLETGPSWTGEIARHNIYLEDARYLDLFLTIAQLSRDADLRLGPSAIAQHIIYDEPGLLDGAAAGGDSQQKGSVGVQSAQVIEIEEIPPALLRQAVTEAPQEAATAVQESGADGQQGIADGQGIAVGLSSHLLLGNADMAPDDAMVAAGDGGAGDGDSAADDRGAEEKNSTTPQPISIWDDEPENPTVREEGLISELSVRDDLADSEDVFGLQPGVSGSSNPPDALPEDLGELTAGQPKRPVSIMPGLLANKKIVIGMSAGSIVAFLALMLAAGSPPGPTDKVPTTQLGNEVVAHNNSAPPLGVMPSSADPGQSSAGGLAQAGNLGQGSAKYQNQDIGDRLNGGHQFAGSPFVERPEEPRKLDPQKGPVKEPAENQTGLSGSSVGRNDLAQSQAQSIQALQTQIEALRADIRVIIAGQNAAVQPAPVKPPSVQPGRNQNVRAERDRSASISKPAPEKPDFVTKKIDGRTVYFLPTASGEQIAAALVNVIRGESLDEFAFRLNVSLTDILAVNPRLGTIPTNLPLDGGKLLVPVSMSAADHAGGLPANERQP